MISFQSFKDSVTINIFDVLHSNTQKRSELKSMYLNNIAIYSECL